MDSVLEVDGATPEIRWPKLIDALEQEGIIQTQRIKDAFLACARHLLADPTDEEGRLMLAGEDSAFHIGYDQSISQPRMVAIMTELLQPQKGETALDVGLGSGWQAMILRELVGETGTVFGIERIGMLLDETRVRLSRIHIDDIAIIHGDALNPAQVPDGPFDMISCAAGCEKVPDFWADRLSVKGRMVYPKQVGEIRGGVFYYQGGQQEVGDVDDCPVHRLCITKKSPTGLVHDYHGQPCCYVPLMPDKR